MAEENENNAKAEAPAQQFGIIKIYVKDASFESPHVPELFSGNATISPSINLQLNSEARKIGDDAYEVTLSVVVTATENDKTLYLIELKQAGIFLVKGYDQPTRENLIGSHCPSSLFPYARQSISRLVSDGGFPQLLLEPISFEALYAQHMAKKQTAPAPTTKQ